MVHALGRQPVDRLVQLGRLPRGERPRYETIADPGLLRSMRLNAAQIDIPTRLATAMIYGIRSDTHWPFDLGHLELYR